jgi:ubiquinone/menaquinone biosynthesis C-methylase UbiE
MKDSLPDTDYLNHLLGLSKGFMVSRIFLSAIELNVFDQLGTERLTSHQAAKLLHTDERATEILLDALTAMGLLEKNGSVFSNIQQTSEILTSDSPCSIGKSFGHASRLWDSWSNLTQIVKTGNPVIPESTDKMRANLSLFMKQHARGQAKALANALDCSNVIKMLDLGGGSASYAIGLAQRYPHLKIESLDRDDQALMIAKEEIIRTKLQERINLRKGDFFVDDIGSDYDLVMLSSIICLFGEKENLYLINKIKESLKFGGRLVILDVIPDETKTKPTSAALFSVNMLVTTQGGRAYSFSEVKQWLLSSGLKDIERIPVNHSQLITGRK